MIALHDAHVALFSKYLIVNPLAFYRFHLTRLSYEDPSIAAFYDPVTDTVGDGYTARVPLARVVGRDVVELAMISARNGKPNAQFTLSELIAGWRSNTTKAERNTIVGAHTPTPKSGVYFDTETHVSNSIVYTGDGRATRFNFDDVPVQQTTEEGPKTTPDGRPIREHNYLNLRKGYKR